MAMFSRVISVVAVLLCAVPVVWAQGPESVVGRWKMVTIVNGQENESTVTFEMKDGALAGKVAGRRGERELLDVTFENGTLSWGIIIPRAGSEPLRTTVTVQGDSFEGAVKTPLGEMQVRGTRWSEESEQQSVEKLKAMLGEWDLITTRDGKDTEARMRLRLDEENDLRVSFLTPATELETRRVRFDGETLTFAVVIPFVGEEPARGQLKMAENKCEGTITGPLGDIAVRGSLIDTTKLVLAPYDDPAPVLGNWDVVANVNGEESRVKLSLTPDGERVKGVITTDNGSYESQEVDYKKVGEKMGRVRLTIVIPDLGEKPQSFELIFDGDTFEGEEIYSNGAIYFTGTRAS